ncbi:GNAT family N-acetyltransferase [Shewanella psychropiezotolerans]|uniref:GNAT family N-acetyltransferase n=1 Tax=Shewanella psychropiezotolerans TaxID=2593655 RepID=A0ABX5X0T7_9GAMM|nr:MULTISPECIES: GNAT family N-acetyltransferase [Shewanella]MPY21393.1 GNAT family N-acetyltransferase [Shewanella sp. YLB-07]MPY22180.1 GNAT family N-acetyltransferase [Shewanella sp. YLB-07]QDO84969.1 GNAT family N-acetyltransferase [Shewanella psychropiezotolerans]
MENSALLYQFETPRLVISAWPDSANHQVPDMAELASMTLDILTPNVTRALPPGWQNIHNLEEAKIWLEARVEECSFLVVRKRETRQVIGFIFLHEERHQEQELPSDKVVTLHLGYLLTESQWGQGFACEMIKGLVAWAKSPVNSVRSSVKDSLIHVCKIVAGVESSNLASIAVLVNTGFSLCFVSSEDSEKGVDDTDQQVFYHIVFQD